MTSAAQRADSENPLVYLKHHDNYSDASLRKILSSVRTIAMVGASTHWKRPSSFAMKYLMKKGYRVIPINPTRAGEEIFGEKVLGSIAECPDQIDMVDVFRKSEDAYEVTKDVIAAKDEKNIKVLWMQLSVRNDPAAELAEATGLTVIMDRCPKIEYARLSGELSWGGINSRIVSAKSLKSPRA